ncbi:MAG TPA: sigma-54-dependent Fis family transcriptional regulator [Kofleriaceae bacterium]|nr:sigma-54-dependent Fis family transcriptional regulator [Kofleriaceae bacterium]
MKAEAIARALQGASSQTLERELMRVALEATGTHHGALFLWDRAARQLVLAHHVVSGVTVTIPSTAVTRAGVALHVFEEAEPYLCRDTARDPHYTRYLLDVGSIAAAPIRYQRRVIGVITVSARDAGALGRDELRALVGVATAAGSFVGRAQLDRQSREATGRPFLILGLSPEWLAVERRIELASPTDAPILVRGESGTGKDLVARAIHMTSRRADGPYVTVNCAAIPETLLESILFGHVRGAFTGASFEKVGEFRKANGGTLFLDEVGELPVMLQAKVLRAVEQGEIQPLGSNAAPERVDVRLICATNRPLERMVAERTFRDDLFYRLSVMTLELPPLRRYKEQLEVTASVFVELAAARLGKKAPRIGADALALLRAYDYPGNVRELRNAIEHAVILCTGDELRPEDLPGPFHAARGAPLAAAQPAEGDALASLGEMRERWLAPLERRYLVEVLAANAGNVRRAAEHAGVDPATFYRLLRRRGVTVRRQPHAELTGAGPEGAAR